MGRGQLFCFGRNVWRTCQFEMVVDIDDHLGYELRDDCEYMRGCSISIELNSPLSEAEIARTLADLRRDTKWMKIRVVVNEHEYSSPPSSIEWRYKTGWYYFQPNRTGVLRVYNLGLLVREFPNDRLRIGGDMVSAVPLQLNTARTDIMDSCPVWREFKNSLDEIRNVMEAELAAGIEQLMPKKKRRQSSSPRTRRERNPANTVPYVKVALRSRQVDEICHRMANEKKELEDRGEHAGRVLQLLGNTLCAAYPMYDRMTWFRVMYDRGQEPKWTSLNGLYVKTADRNRRIVFGSSTDRHFQLALKAKIAAGVLVSPEFSMPSRLSLLLAVYAMLATKKHSKLILLDMEEVEKLGRTAALVVETTKLSGMEKSVLQAVREAYYELSSVSGVQIAEYCFAYFADGKPSIMNRSLFLDREECHWVKTFDGWLKMGSEIAQACVGARFPEKDGAKYDQHRRELWWQLQRVLWKFAVNGLRAIARSQAVDLEEQVRIAAAKEVDQCRYLSEVKHRRDLALMTINSLRDTVFKLDQWMANTVEPDQTVSLHKDRKRNVLPDDWDADLPKSSTDYEAAAKLGLAVPTVSDDGDDD
jgi:hypothetical protein